MHMLIKKADTCNWLCVPRAKCMFTSLKVLGTCTSASCMYGNCMCESKIKKDTCKSVKWRYCDCMYGEKTVDIHAISQICVETFACIWTIKRKKAAIAANIIEGEL